MTEYDLQTKLIAHIKFKEWMGSLPEQYVFQIQNEGFQLHHLIGKYWGYLDEEMNTPSLWIHVGLDPSELSSVLEIYNQIIKKLYD